MTIKEAIEKAIAGGWRNPLWPNLDFTIGKEMKGTLPNELGVLAMWNTNRSSFHISLVEAVLDPTFWQALGKSEGWNTLTETGDYSYQQEPRLQETWLYHMHHMIDHIADGGTINSFIETL